MMLKPSQVWQSEPHPLTTSKRLLVVVMLRDDIKRKKAEAEWVLNLRSAKIVAAPSYAIIDDIEAMSASKIIRLQQSHGVDSVLVVSVALGNQGTGLTGLQLDDYLQQQQNLGFDVFMQQMESVTADVTIYSLLSNQFIWFGSFDLPVIRGDIDWPKLVNSANGLFYKAGLAPIPPKKEETLKAN